MNPLARLLAGILAVLAVAGAFVFGLFVFAVLLGAGVLLWLSVMIRGWWLQRNRRHSAADPAPREPETIEAEYTVISRRRE